MEKAMQIFECIPRVIPLAARVDGIYFAAKTREDISEVATLARLHHYPISNRFVYAIKDSPTVLPVNAQSWTYRTVPTPAIGEWLHVHDHTFDEIDGASYEDKITRTVLKNEGGLITGPAGTGKSVLLKQIRQAIKDRGETVFTCAYTHAAARLIGGMTVARLLHYGTRLHDAWILIDEISLRPIDTIG